MIAAWCCGVVSFALGVVGAFMSYGVISDLLYNVGGPPVSAREEFQVSRGAGVAFLVELLVVIAVLVWLVRARPLERWHPAFRFAVFGFCVGFLGLTSLCNVFSIWAL